MTNPKDTAFVLAPSPHTYVHPGLTKREFFAGMVFSGIGVMINITDENLPKRAVELADALIAELNK